MRRASLYSEISRCRTDAEVGENTDRQGGGGGGGLLLVLETDCRSISERFKIQDSDSRRFID